MAGSSSTMRTMGIFFIRCSPPALTALPTQWHPWSGEDRKSTRLNSSHLVISYAVFCLKKKTKIDNPCPAIIHRAHERRSIGAQHVNRLDDYAPKRKHSR